MRRAASASGSRVPGRTSSMAIMAPRPRTSPMPGWVRSREPRRCPMVARRCDRAAPARPSVLHGGDRGQGGGARHRVAAVGPAQPAGVDAVHQLGPPGDGGQGHAAGQGLGRGDQVGHHRPRGRRRTSRRSGRTRSGSRRPRTGTRLPAPGRHGGEEAGGRHHEAALALDRLDQHAGHVLRPHLPLDLLDGPGRGLFAGHPLGIPQRVRHRAPGRPRGRRARTRRGRACSWR